MTTDEAGAWGAFTGRESELSRLLEHWERVKEGEGPRVAVLLAEPGLGKTRLAQELYGRLVAAEQGGPGYWPPSLGVEGDNLTVNPHVDECDAGADVPFLWWGVRLSDPDGRNSVVSGVLASHVDAYLVPHLEPFQREQRRRQRLMKVARMGGALAADFVADAVPFLGLLKKVGEVGMEVKALHDEWRRDAKAVSAGSVASARRASLAEQVVADLSTLFAAAGDVPAVVLLDDLQFSHSDPGVTAFVAELVEAMRGSRWPLLLLVTHWEREWRVAAGEAEEGSTPPSPAGAVLAQLARRDPELVDVVKLGPVQDLAPLARRVLPGLPDEQVRALLERAGGNPRLLEEVLRFAVTPRGRGMFVGRDPSGPLTERGLEELLSRGSRLAELVARRFEEAPEGVQKALALAASLGQEFEAWLVGEVVAALAGDARGDTARSLRAAANPHAMTAYLTEHRAAFAQRVYRDVALEFLPGWFDEAEVEEALAAVLRDCLEGRVEVPYDTASVRGMMAVAGAVFEGRAEDAKYAAVALHWLLRDAMATGDLHGAAALARRLAVVLETLGDDQDGDLAWLHDAVAALMAVDDAEAVRPLLVRLLRLAGEAYDEAVTEWTVPLYITALMDASSFYAGVGDQENSHGAAMLAVNVLVEAQGQVSEDDTQVLAASVRVHEYMAEWLSSRGHLADALQVRENTLALIARIRELEPGRGPLGLANARVALAGELVKAGRHEDAEPLVEAALADLRAMQAEVVDMGAEWGLEMFLSGALDVAGQVARARGGEAKALRRFEESLEIDRRHHEATPGATATAWRLAHALTRVADQRSRVGDQAGAWAAVCEAVELRRVLATGSGEGALWLGESLRLAAGVAAQREDLPAAHELAQEALLVLRRLHQSPDLHGEEENLDVRWNLIGGLIAAVMPALRVEGAEAAAALVTEAQRLLDGVPESNRERFARMQAVLARLDAHVRSQSGQVDA